MDVVGIAGIPDVVFEAAGTAKNIVSVIETVIDPELVTTRVVHTLLPDDGGAFPTGGTSVNGDPSSLDAPAAPYIGTSSIHFHPKQSQTSTKSVTAQIPPQITLHRTSSQSTIGASQHTPLPSSTPLPTQSTGGTSTTMSTALPSLFDTSGTDTQHGPPKAAVIAGATVGGLAGLAAFLAILILCFRRRRRLMPTRAAHRGSIESAGSSDASFFSPPHPRRSTRDTSGSGSHAAAPMPASRDKTIARKPVPPTMSTLIPAAHWRNDASRGPHDPASWSEDMQRPSALAAESASQSIPPRRRPSQDFIAPRPAPPTTRPAPVARGHVRDGSQPILAPPLPIIPTLTSQPTGPPPQRPPRPQESMTELPPPQHGQQYSGPLRPGGGENRLNELHFDFDLTPGGQYNRQPGYMNNRGQPPPRFNLSQQTRGAGPGPQGPRPSRLPPVQQQKQWPPAYPPVPSYDRSGGQPRGSVPAPMNPQAQEWSFGAPHNPYHQNGPPNSYSKLPQPRKQRGPAIRVVTPSDSTFPVHSGSDSVSTITQTYPAIHNSQQQQAPQMQSSLAAPQRYPVNPSPLGPHHAQNQHCPPSSTRPNPSAYARPGPGGFTNNYQGLSPGYGPGPSPSPAAYYSTNTNTNLSPAAYRYPPGRFSAYDPSILSAATSRRVSYDEFGRRRRSDPFDLE